MDLKHIEKLMAAMVRAGINRLAYKQEGFEIELEREGSSQVSYLPPSPAPIFQEQERPRQPSSQPSSGVSETKSALFVTSPMVGTYYSAPSPDDPPFVKVGDAIESDQVVCIIEAMKVMNEVKAQLRGKVVEILVKNGDPVEFGTKIFRVEPT